MTGIDVEYPEWSPLAWTAGRTVHPPLTGASHDGWHAVAKVFEPPNGADAAGGVALCGATVGLARGEYGPFDPDRFPRQTCLECVWRFAITTGDLAGRYRALLAGGVPVLAAELAEAIVTVASSPLADYDLEHPFTVGLLVAVSEHAPTALISRDCAEGGHDHDEDEFDSDGRCPTVAIACMACSLLTGDWAGDWEGTCLPECTVAAPCEVLRTLAAHYERTGGAR